MSDGNNSAKTQEKEGAWELFVKNLVKQNQPLVEKLVKALEDGGLAPTIKIKAKDAKEKSYVLREIEVGQQLELEKMRDAFYNKAKTPGDRLQLSAEWVEIYIKMAEYYLGIPREEFLTLPWPTLRVWLDACEWRMQYGSPLSLKI